MAKNEQSREANQPIWFDGKSINEALFCDDFLGRHKIIYTNGAFFTPDGRVTDELPLRGEIFEELKCCAVSNIPRKISNIVELMKLAALVENREKLQVGTTGKTIVFTKENFSFAARIMEGPYLAVSQVLSNLKQQFTVLTDAALLRDTILQALSVTGTQNRFSLS